MPTWAIIYCLFITIAGIVTMVMNSNRSRYYVPGEILSVFCVIYFFLIRYEIILIPSSIVTPLVATIYILYWEGWENRHYYFNGIPVKEPGRTKWFKKNRGQIAFITAVVILFFSPLLLVITLVFNTYGI